VNWRVYELTQKGILNRVGRGLFTFSQKLKFIPIIESHHIQINKYIKKNLPFIDYCIWSTRIIQEFTRHVPFADIIFVEVEKGLEQSTYHRIKDRFKNTFLKPDSNFYSNYILDFKKALVVKTLTSEAPTQVIQGVRTITIEKLLVDIFADPFLFYFRGKEMEHIYNNSFDMYNVNYSKLYRYADRKGRKNELKDYLRTYNLAENQ